MHIHIILHLFSFLFSNLLCNKYWKKIWCFHCFCSSKMKNKRNKHLKSESSLFPLPHWTPFNCSLSPLAITVPTCMDQKHVLKLWAHLRESMLWRPINIRGKAKFDLRIWKHLMLLSSWEAFFLDFSHSEMFFS